MIAIDMKMPDNCWDCPFYERSYGVCSLYMYGIPGRLLSDEQAMSGRQEWCELKEVED